MPSRRLGQFAHGKAMANVPAHAWQLVQTIGEPSNNPRKRITHGRTPRFNTFTYKRHATWHSMVESWWNLRCNTLDEVALETFRIDFGRLSWNMALKKPGTAFSLSVAGQSFHPFWSW